MRRVSTVVRHAVLVLFLVVTAYPLIWMVLTSCRSEGAAQRAPFALPRRLVLANLQGVLSSGLFTRAYANSLIVCGIGVVASVGFAALAAFAFARMRFRGRHVVFLAFLLGMMIPIHVTLIPLNRLLGPGGFGLKGTLWALIGPYIGFALPISILILRGAFEGLPGDLVDASRMDGCSAWGVFLHVGLPLVRPALATVFIFNFLTMWNEFAFALTFLEPDSPTLPLAVAQFRGEHDIEITRTCAALTVAVAPLLLVYACAQRHIIRGLTAGAVKE